jgi:hypothetical protein
MPIIIVAIIKNVAMPPPFEVVHSLALQGLVFDCMLMT